VRAQESRTPCDKDGSSLMKLRLLNHDTTVLRRVA
jgi:hypothetical protein